jgi:hypothetical protein
MDAEQLAEAAGAGVVGGAGAGVVGGAGAGVVCVATGAGVVVLATEVGVVKDLPGEDGVADGKEVTASEGVATPPPVGV